MKLLRALIREEIGRNQRAAERIDFYPWCTPDEKVSIFSNLSDENFTVAAEDLETGEVVQDDFEDQDEAKHWANQRVDRWRREKFAKMK